MKKAIKISLCMVTTMLICVSLLYIYNNTFTTSVIFLLLACILVYLLSDILY